MYVAPQHRDAVAADVVRRLRALVGSAEPGSDAQLQLVTAFAGYAQAPEDTAYLQALLEGSTTLDGPGHRHRHALDAADRAGDRRRGRRAPRSRPSASATTPRPAASGPPAPSPRVPTAEAKADAWQQAVAEDGLANQTVAAVGIGFGRAHDPQLLAPYVARYHDALLEVWTSRTHAIAESIVELFYPQLLASRELADADAGLAGRARRRPGRPAPAGGENRDGITRALAAQERDAARG